MGNQIVDVDLAVHIPVDDLRHVGTAACTPERRALPDTAGDELERTCPDLLASPRDTDNHRYAPAAVTALERLAHDVDVANAFEAVIGTSTRELNEVGDEVATDLAWVHEVR